MKKQFLFYLLFLSTSFPLFAQLKPEVKIKINNTSCEGDSLVVTVDSKNIIGTVNYIWSTDKGDFNAIGDTIKILTKEDIFSETFEITLKAYIEKDKNTLTIEDKKEIKIEKKPTLKNTISNFQKDNDIFLEIERSENETYSWKSPNGKVVNGNIAKFPDPKLSDFGEYQLTITDTNSKCKNEFKYTVKKGEENEDGDVFGSVDEDDIPTNLYKEIQRDVPVYESLITGGNKSSKFLIAYPGYKFTIIGEIEEDYIIRFWKWSEKIDDEKEEDKKDVFLKNPESVPNLTVSGNIVTGNVIDPESKEAVFGAIVKEEGSLIEKTTDIDGYFNIKVSKIPTKLDIRIPGYSSEAITIKKNPSSERNNYLPKDVVEAINLNNKFVVKKRRNGSQDELRYFRIKKSAVDTRALSFLPNTGWSSYSFTAGTVLIPIKIRKSSELGGDDNGFEFSKDVALGPFIGVKKRVSKYKPYFLNAGITVGISSVRLTAGNSNPERTPTVQDLAAFTWAGGLVWEFDKVQVGLFAGKDRINNNFDTINQKGYDWAYQNKWWWSVGFGYALISRPQKNKNSSGEDFGSSN